MHEGLAYLLPLSFGTVTIVRAGRPAAPGAAPAAAGSRHRGQRGARRPAGRHGTVGSAAPGSLLVRGLFLVVGVVICATSGAIYFGSNVGPRPRDGLMTGLVNGTSRSVPLVRTSLELTALPVGFLLGGTVGAGTSLFAVAIGPLIQFFLPRSPCRSKIPHRPGVVSACRYCSATASRRACCLPSCPGWP
jgi:hypothetical protein